MQRSTKILLVSVLTLLFTVPVPACDMEKNETSEATQKQRKATEQLHTEAWKQVGMPALDNFQEMRIMKQIQELRDQQLTTYTYTVDRDAELSFLCPSLGYGLPYSTQMTNPKKTVDADDCASDCTQDQVIPQPEPNGLYMPNNVAATWVLCQNPESGGVAPVYSEPNLIVSPFPLEYEKKYADGKDVDSVMPNEKESPKENPQTGSNKK